jgi:PAS domain S-box-containing protein
VWTDITERKRAEEIVQQTAGRSEQARRSKVRRDLIVFGPALVVVYGLATYFGWLGTIVHWIGHRRYLPGDEIVVAALFVGVWLAAFAFRRWRETESELSSGQQAQAALELLHQELARGVKQRTVELDTANQALRTEVAERRKAETVLKESNRRFDDMLANLGLIAMTLDSEGTVTFCNDFLLRLTGWKREEIIGHTWFDKFLPESAAEVKKLFLDGIGSGNIPSHYQNPIQTRTGELREILWNNTLLRDAAGNIVGTASIGEDVTERSRAEAALRASEARFRELAENIQEVFWIADAETNRVIYVSPAYAAIWGRSCQSLYESPRAWLEAICPEDRDRVLLAVQTKQAPGKYDEEYRILRPDGSERWIRDRAFPVRDAGGRIQRFVGVAQDITESKNLQAQFLHAQRLESIGMLAAGIAHDLNNVLAPIVFAAPMLRESLSTARDLKILDTLERSAGRGAGLVKQILGFAQSTTGEFRPTQVKHLAQDIINVIEETFPKTIQIQHQIPKNLWPVLGDATQIHQILLNLCVNARDAMPTGGTLGLIVANRHLDVEQAKTLPGARPGAWLVVEVTDTGTGIAPDILAQIWDPFFTTKPAGKGTGLGLSTVRSLVAGHHGFVTLDTQLGRGTSFRVFLPAIQEDVEHHGRTPALGTPPGNGELILVVDDDTAVRETVASVLVKQRYRVLTAADGVEALDHFTAHSQEIALVISDVDMPRLGGIALAGILAQFRPELRLLVISGMALADPGDSQDEPTKKWTHPFLLKPFSHQMLVNSVHELLHPAPLAARGAKNTSDRVS